MPASLRRRLEREIEGRSALSAISVLEERLFLAERLLPDNDAASMAASIEQRLPLVDHVLFGKVDRLADKARYAPVRSKSILRRVGLRGLDPALFDRPKSGFTMPFEQWIRKGLHRSVDQTLRDQRMPCERPVSRPSPWSGSGGRSSTARPGSIGLACGRCSY